LIYSRVAANKLKTTEHIGTHLDAPYHFHEHSWQMQQIPLDHLIGPGVIVDVKTKVANNPDYRLTQSDLEAWENNYGKIPDGAIVLMNSGWHDKHPDKKLIWGSQDPLNTSSLHYPGWHEDAVVWLASHRSIHIIGVDSPSLDYGQSATFPVHVLSSKENICGLENVAYLDKIPANGSIISAAAVKNVGGTGFPARVYAMIPENGAFANSSDKTQLMFLCMLISSLSALILVY
jgi:kynurenine formamidase